jgi:hypothetical protein
MSDATAEHAYPGTLVAAAARARDFRLLMAGSYVSMLGSRISTIACPLLALYLWRSPFAAGLVAFAATVPSVLVYVPAGALVDRWDPRRTLILSEAGRGMAIAMVAVTLAIGRPGISLLIIVVFIEETLEVFSTLADRRCARALVPIDRVSSAQANIEARSHAVILAGRPLGVFLFSLTPILPFLADALSFIVSVGTIISLKSRSAVAARAGRVSRRQLGNDIGDGLIWLLRDRYARAAFALSAGTTLIGQALIMVFLAGAHASGLPSIWVGLVLAASGVGGLLGSMCAPWLPIPRKSSLVLLQMVAWAGVLVFLAVWGWRSFLCMAIVMAALSLTGALGNIEIDIYLVQRADENMLARATSIRRFISFSACAVGPMLGALLIQLYGAQNAVFALLAITSIFALLAWFTPSMRGRVIAPVDGQPGRPQLQPHLAAAWRVVHQLPSALPHLSCCCMRGIRVSIRACSRECLGRMTTGSRRLVFSAVAGITAVVLHAVAVVLQAFDALSRACMPALTAESAGILSLTVLDISRLPVSPIRVSPLATRRVRLGPGGQSSSSGVSITRLRTEASAAPISWSADASASDRSATPISATPNSSTTAA